MFAAYLKPSTGIEKFFQLSISIVLLFAALMTNESYAAVILQYHHVSDKTPRSTSLSEVEFIEHINWLNKNEFSIIPLPELIERIKNKQLSNNEKVAVITFDDTGETVCSTAAPLLLERNWPFTIFINTEAMHGSRQCSWESIAKLQQTGLLTIGNHSHSHPHMLTRLVGEDSDSWKERIKNEILRAEKIIEKNTGERTSILAYPYGEYDLQILAITDMLGYSAVGQQSGAIGNYSDLTALPRFPLSGVYANIDNIANKLLSLPFPIKSESLLYSTDQKKSLLEDGITTEAITEPASNYSPVRTDENNSISNAPILQLEFSEKVISSIQCFLGNGERITTNQSNTSVSTQYHGQLKNGRNRYNCTAASTLSGRFFWYSRQWVQ